MNKLLIICEQFMNDHKWSYHRKKSYNGPTSDQAIINGPTMEKNKNGNKCNYLFPFYSILFQRNFLKMNLYSIAHS